MTTTTKNFDAALDAWIEKLQERINADYAEHFSNLTPPTLSVDMGRKYAKIVRTDAPECGTQRSVHSFVERETGIIRKAAGWKKPALNIKRGNIYDDDGGLSWITPRGTVSYAG